MARSLKVFGAHPAGRLYVPTALSPHRQARHIVATTSKAAALRLLGTAAAYTTETGNAAEIAAARASPGVVLWQTDRIKPIFAPVPSRPEGLR